MKSRLILFLCCAVLPLGGHAGLAADQPLKTFNFQTDWVVSPEYYGFFYAQAEGIYRKVGLDVKISYGSGAPATAAQLGAGTIYAGTTTSDQILRQISRGARFTKAVPVLRFNPSVIASMKANPVRTPKDLVGRKLGTPTGYPVDEMQYLMSHNGLSMNVFKAHPIGYGGSPQLVNKVVDAIIAWTTNAVVDLEVKGYEVVEMFAGEFGVKKYGMVIVIARPERLHKAGLSRLDADLFIAASLQGYRMGAKHLERTSDILRALDPNMQRKRTIAAIKKIASLNQFTKYTLSELDSWLQDKRVSAEHRKLSRQLYLQ